MNLEELKAQIKELDENIDTKRRELDELVSFRASLGGAPAPVRDTRSDSSPIATPDQPDPRTQWTPEQQAALRAEALRVKEHARFNQNMPKVGVNVQTQRIQIPPGATAADVVPHEMKEWLNA